ncbi:DMP19 family protein [Primorskyibacter sp. 2E107]|uniref:DMP19 family protein n=1 Tax=Primorskyibacter sp. 2E107 TaxID=3403458 RepID=UPI003AF4274F
MFGKLKQFLSGDASAEAFKNRKPGGGTRMGGAPSDPPQEPPARPPEANNPPPQLDRIIVPQSAMDALPDDPAPLVLAVVRFTNHMTGEGRYKRTELPPAALQAFHCDYYLAQVNNGGHAQFVHNTLALIEDTFEDVVTGLKAMGAMDYLILARSAQKWVRDNPEEAAQQTGFEGGIADGLRRLDQPFFQLDRKTPLQAFIARWIAGHPQLEVVADEDWGDALQDLADANPERARRDAIIDCAATVGRFANPLLVGASMGCWRIGEADFLLGVSNGSYRDVDGTQEMAFKVQSLGGPRFAVPVEGQGVTLYDCIRHDNSHMPKDPFKASLDDIRQFRPDELSERLAHVTQAEIQTAIETAERLKVGAAIHLLKSRIPDMDVLPTLTIIHAGPGPNGELLFTCAFPKDGGAWLFKIGPVGAIYTHPGKGPEGSAAASRAEIDFHAETHRLEGLR